MQVVTGKECIINLSSTANLTENIIYKSTVTDMFIVYQFLCDKYDSGSCRK